VNAWRVRHGLAPRRYTQTQFVMMDCHIDLALRLVKGMFTI
jgi:hypothetical protein